MSIRFEQDKTPEEMERFASIFGTSAVYDARNILFDSFGIGFVPVTVEKNKLGDETLERKREDKMSARFEKDVTPEEMKRFTDLFGKPVAYDARNMLFDRICEEKDIPAIERAFKTPVDIEMNKLGDEKILEEGRRFRLMEAGWCEVVMPPEVSDLNERSEIVMPPKVRDFYEQWCKFQKEIQQDEAEALGLKNKEEI